MNQINASFNPFAVFYGHFILRKDFSMKKIVLIDGHSILNRAFYGIPLLTTQEGLHTNAVYGFLNIMLKLVEEEKPDSLAVAFDVKHPTFRHDLYAEYKGTRSPMPIELKEQVSLIQEVLTAMGIPHIECPGYEADDILGTLSKKAVSQGMEAIILTGDRDLLQLTQDNITLLIPKSMKGKTEVFRYNEETFTEQYGVTPTEYIDMKALMGDSSDNIPGLPKIGEKTARNILQSWHSIENAYAHADEITPAAARASLTEHYELAIFYRKLTKICTDAPVPFDLKEAEIQNFYTKEAYAYFKRLEFKSFLSRFDASVTAEVSSTDFDTNICEEINDTAKLYTRFQDYTDAPAIGLAALTQDHVFYGLAIYACDKPATYFPVQGNRSANTLFSHALSDFLKQYLESSPHHRVASPDVKALYHILEEDFPYTERLTDTTIAAYLIQPQKGSYTYENLALEYAEATLPAQEELLGKAKLPQAFLMQIEQIAALSSMMAVSALISYPKLLDTLQSLDMYDLYLQLELPTCHCLARMEEVGILAEKDFLKNYSSMLSREIQATEDRIYDTVGEPFNINSPKQLGTILFEKMQLPGGKKTKTGYSTSADILEKLTGQYPLVAEILKYRTLTKLRSTYAEGLQTFIENDGRIHSTFNQTVTATGRISSTDPNLQNIPTRTELGRELRKVFVAENGCVLVDADFSQIELRVLAHMSGDANLIEAYNSAKDIHAITASWVFNVPLEQVDADLRRKAKAVNFGIVYGISAFGLSEDLNISREDANAYIKRYFEVYPGIKEYLDRLVNETKASGYSYTLYKRRRPVEEIHSANFMTRSAAERIAMNSPIQGTAADIMKLAVIRVDRALTQAGLKGRIVLQVHDEIIVECPKEEQAQVAKLLTEEMEHAASLSIPLIVEAHSGKNWYDAK